MSFITVFKTVLAVALAWALGPIVCLLVLGGVVVIGIFVWAAVATLIKSVRGKSK